MNKIQTKKCLIKWLVLLGQGHWKLRIWTDVAKEEMSSLDTVAEVDYDFKYLDGDLFISELCPQGEEEEQIVHEVSHLVLAPTRCLTKRLIRMLPVSEEIKEALVNEAIINEEQAVVNFSRALYEREEEGNN